MNKCVEELEITKQKNKFDVVIIQEIEANSIVIYTFNPVYASLLRKFGIRMQIVPMAPTDS